MSTVALTALASSLLRRDSRSDPAVASVDLEAIFLWVLVALAGMLDAVMSSFLTAETRGSSAVSFSSLMSRRTWSVNVCCCCVVEDTGVAIVFVELLDFSSGFRRWEKCVFCEGGRLRKGFV